MTWMVSRHMQLAPNDYVYNTVRFIAIVDFLLQDSSQTQRFQTSRWQADARADAELYL